MESKYSILNMSELLQQLGDDWHHPAPYLQIVDETIPDSQYKKNVHDYLVKLYCDSFSNFKNYDRPFRDTMYDNEIDSCLRKKEALEKRYKQEEESFEKLCGKFAELGGHAKETGEDNTSEEEEENTYLEEDRYQGAAPQKDVTVKQKGGPKETPKQKKEREKREAALLETTKNAMATVQQSMMDIVKEIDLLDLKMEAYKHYQYADLAFSNEMRKHVLAYKQEKNITNLIQDLDKTFAYYNMIRKRYVSKAPCQGGSKELCKSHFLPLYPTKFLKNGEGDGFMCACAP